MKRTSVLTAIVFAGVGLALAAQGRSGRTTGPNLPQPGQIRLPPIEKIQKVKDNLYMIPGAGGNTAVFVTAGGVMLVDTKVPNNGQAILDQVRTVTDKPVTTLINTHSHFDHVGSNEFFPANVQVVAHENTRANMAKTDDVRNNANAMPDRTYKDRFTIGRGADQVDLYYFGPGHTNGDSLVVFTALRTMHTGDLFAEKQPPLLDRDNGGSGVAYPDTLEKAVKGIRNVDTIIPGHSAVSKWVDFTEYAEFNREFLKAVENLHHAGRTPEQAGAELKLPAKFNSYVSPAPPAPGLEFLGSGQQRARGNVATIMAELNGPPR